MKTMTVMDAQVLAEALRDGFDASFVSPNEMDSNFEPANVVDALFFIGRAIERLADVLDSAKSAGGK